MFGLFRARSNRDYKVDIRRRAPVMTTLIELGWSVKTVAKALRVSTTTVYNDLHRQSDTYSLNTPPDQARHEVLRRSFRLRSELLWKLTSGTITTKEQSVYDALLRCMEPFAP